MSESYVLDSFALLAHLENEKRGIKVTDILKRTQQFQNIKLYLSVINLGEVYYITMRERGKRKADDVLELIMQMRIEIIEADFDLTLEAAVLKAQFSAAYADCFAAALAIKKDAKVITGDPEFKQMEPQVKVEWL